VSVDQANSDAGSASASMTKRVIFSCPSIRPIPMLVAAVFPNRWVVWLFCSVREHHRWNSFSLSRLNRVKRLFYRNIRYFEHRQAPPILPTRSRSLFRQLIVRNKTDRLHDAKPNEWDDTFRGDEASYRSRSESALSAIIKSTKTSSYL